MNKFRKRKAQLIIGSILIMLLITSCAGGSTTEESEASPIGNTYWQLDSYALPDTGEVSRIPESTVLLFFGDNGGIFGFSGCNFLTGSYNISGEAITVAAGPSTTYECQDDLFIQEQAFIGALTYMGMYQVEGELMNLTNPNGDEFVNMTQISPPPKIQGTDWLLKSYNDGQGALVTVLEGSEVTAKFSQEGNLTGSAGCNEYNTTYEVTGERITIGQTSSTEKACLDPEGIMDQETRYLAALQNSTIFRNLVAGLILFDENEKPTTFFVTGE